MTSPLLSAESDPIRAQSIWNWWWKGRKTKPIPYLSLDVGSDEKSCGATVYLTHRLGTDGRTRVEHLVAVRWREKPETAEDLVLLAQKALRALAYERGWQIAE